jgi:hypothetical protein
MEIRRFLYGKRGRRRIDKEQKRRNTFPCRRCFELPAGEYWVEQILSVMVAGRLVKPQTYMLCDATPPKQMLKP